MFVLYKSIFAGCLLKSQVGVDMNKERTQKEKARDRAHNNQGITCIVECRKYSSITNPC